MGSATPVGRPMLDRVTRRTHGAPIVGAATIVASLTILAGWQLSVPALTRVAPDWPPVEPLTAVAFVLAGVSLGMLRPREAPVGKRWRSGALACASAVAVLGLLTAIEYRAHVAFGIDGLILRHAAVPGEAITVGRMPEATAWSFLLLGTALALLHRRRRLGVAQGLLAALAFLQVFVILWYAYTTGPVPAGQFLAGQTLPSAVLFMAVAVGALVTRSTEGLLAPLDGGSIGARIMRRLLFLIPLVVIGVAILGAWALREHAYNPATDNPMIITGMLVVVTAMIWRHADTVATAEAEADQFFSLEYVLQCLMDRHGIIVRSNPAFTGLLGWTQDECLGHPLVEFVPPAARETFARDLATATANAGGAFFESQMRARGGESRRISWAATTSPRRQFTYVAGRDVTDLRAAQIALREREQNLAITLHAIGDGVIATDAAGRVTHMNPVAERLTGWRQEDASGRPVGEVFRIVHEETREPLEAPVARVLRSGRPDGLGNHTLLLVRGGGENPIGDSAAPIRDAAGTLVGVVMVFRDITVQRTVERFLLDNQAELTRQVEARTAALRESTARLETAERIARMGFLDWELHTNTVYWSDEAVRLFGLPPGSNAQTIESTTGLLHPSDQEMVRRHLEAAVAGGPAYDIEHRMVRPDWSVVWVRAQGELMRGADGTPRRFLITVVDITARKQADEDLRVRVAALDAAADAIVITLPDGTIAWVNKAFSTVSGYSATEAVGRNPRDLVKSGAHDAAFYKGLWDTVLAGHTWRGDMTNRRKDGTNYPEEMTITPVIAPDGAITHFVAIKREMTRQRALEAQFLQAQKMEIVGQLAGGVAHDFNNLLTVINGTVELLTMHLADTDPLVADLRPIKDAGDRAAGITRRLLAFSRKQVMQLGVLDLNATVESMKSMFPRLIKENIHIVFALAEPLGRVYADAGQIDQVILNLAVNAQDAMPEGGTLTIATQDVTLDADYAGGHPSVRAGPYVMLSITDTGNGMDAATMARIFEPFFTTKGVGRGTGLGLSTVYGIVNQSGGSIWVYSEPGQGTTFKIYLPRVNAVPMQETALRARSNRPGTETILVVEDDAALRRLAERALRAGGYTVLTAENGAEAMQVLAQHGAAIQLLLTDLVLPGINGRELAAQIGAANPGLRVLFTSGYADHTILRDGLAAGTMHFITKPYTLDGLREKVREVLDAEPGPDLHTTPTGTP